MADYTTTVRSPWPPEKAFDYLADLRNFSDWDPGVSRSELVKGAGPGEGAEFDVTANGTELRYRITEFRSPDTVAFEARTRFLTSRDRVTITEDPLGCRVRYDAVLELNGPLGNLDPLLAPVFRRIATKAADGLLEALDGTSRT